MTTRFGMPRVPACWRRSSHCLLKPGYLRQRRLYLEHLVVGLYSHAFPCVALLAMLVPVGLDH
ncbi:MAG: hypothetical protein ACYC42_09385 [Lysobacter sp.]